jgi:glucose/arabinose dehydrogenase
MFLGRARASRGGERVLAIATFFLGESSPKKRCLRVCGRPVGITDAKDGTLFISEDGNGTIWNVSYN